MAKIHAPLKSTKRTTARTTAKSQKPTVSVPKSARFKRGARIQATLGIDLGGTKVLAGLVDSNGHILAELRRPTVPAEMKSQSASAVTQKSVRQHISYVIQSIADIVAELELAHPNVEVTGLGLASAGPMNLEKGTLITPANFAGWKTVQLVQLVETALKKKGITHSVHFQNDAMAAALGEGWVGRAKNCKTYVMITVGTGIGTGVILNGRPAQSGGMGSEWGHLLVRAGGLHDFAADHQAVDAHTVEGLSSGTGVKRRGHEMNLPFQSTEELVNLARKGDPKAKQIFAESAESLAALFYNLSLGIHPEMFVVSGGMLAVRDVFLPQTVKIYQTLMKDRYRGFLAPVRVAQLGTKAGLIGAARLPFIK